jgi:hypothetical protein
MQSAKWGSPGCHTVSHDFPLCHTLSHGVARCHTMHTVSQVATRVWRRVPRRGAAQLHRRPGEVPATVSRVLESNGYDGRE